jgi:serine protease inhibitor
MRKTRHPLRLLSGALATAVLAGAVFPALPTSFYSAYAAEEFPEDYDVEESDSKQQYEVTLHNVIFQGMDVYPDDTDYNVPEAVRETDAVYLTTMANFRYGSRERAIAIKPFLCFDENSIEFRRDAYNLFSEFSENNYVDVTFITDKDYSSYPSEDSILRDLRQVAAVKCVKIPGSHIIGDVNDDNGIDTYDMILLRDALTNGVNETLNEDQRKNAEITGDGQITADDLNELSNYLLGAEASFNAPSAIGSIRLDETVSAIRSDGKKSDTKFSASQMNLGIRLLQKLNADETTKKGQMLISPLSASAALTMTANGADNETLEDMQKVLGNGISLNDLNEYFSWYMQNLPETKKEKVEIANSIWFRDCDWLKVHDSFLEANKKYFASEVYKSAYDAGTVKDINSWVNRCTKGMIPQLLNNPHIFDDPNSCMTLINTLYFEADWANPYRDSTPAVFTREDGTEQPINALFAGSDNYYELDNALAFKKNYAGKYKFIGILPDKGITLDEYIASIDPAKLSEQLRTPGDMDNTIVSTMIPKFKYDYSCSMKDSLKALGMERAMYYETADFTRMAEVTNGNKLYIDDVIQKTNIELTEKGTKAAAATAVMMEAGSAYDPNPPRYIYIHLDRPFIYMIVDENDTPAFIGCISDFSN